jgi:hypothetical protein
MRQNPFLYAEDGSMEHIKLGEGQVKSSGVPNLMHR